MGEQGFIKHNPYPVRVPMSPDHDDNTDNHINIHTNTCGRPLPTQASHRPPCPKVNYCAFTTLAPHTLPSRVASSIRIRTLDQQPDTLHIICTLPPSRATHHMISIHKLETHRNILQVSTLTKYLNATATQQPTTSRPLDH